MKKLCIVLALLLALCTLCACPRVEPEEITTTTEEITEPPISTDPYIPIIEEFTRLVREQSDDYDAWEAIGIAEPPQEYGEGSLGYAFRDINGDRTPELLLLDKMNGGTAGQPFVYALYTLKDKEEPVLLGNYWSRNRVQIDKDGRIFTTGSDSAWSLYLNSYQLNANAGALTHMTDYYTDVDARGNPCWVMRSQGREEPLSEKQFDTLVGLYEKPAWVMLFDFVAVDQ